MKKTKRRKQIEEKIDRTQFYTVGDALERLKEVKATNFDETVEVHMRLGIDPRKPDQNVRGSCTLPNGLGKTVRVLVFAKGDKALEARDAGADYVGGEELIKEIQGGWFEFDRVVACPDMMSLVGRIGKLLGPRGLMPNPKVGTVTFDLAATIKDLKAGQVELRADKTGNVHAPAGKISFSTDTLKENIQAIIDTVFRLKPAASKGLYVKNCSVSSTMGPGLTIDVQSVK